MTPSLLSAWATALIFAGCTQTGTYYEADAIGRFRKVPDVIPGHRADGAAYVVNGQHFQDNFRAIGGNAEIRDEGSTHLATGEYKRVFYKLRGAALPSTGRSLFGGIVRRLHDSSLTTAGLESDAHSGGETENMLQPQSRPVAVEYRQVNGRRWLVTTCFDNSERRVVANRTYWCVIGGLLVTFYVDLDASTPSEPEWVQQNLDSLHRLVSDFRYLGHGA